jgi:predicted porin
LPGVGTKLGASYGESNLETTGGINHQQNSWIVGAYHPLTKSVNLVAEYNYARFETDAKPSTNAKTVSLGAIMFF